MCVVSRLLCIGCCLLVAGCRSCVMFVALLLAVGNVHVRGLLVVVCSLPFVVRCLLCAVFGMVYVVCCLLLVVVCCSLVAVCCLLPVVR